MSGNRNKKVGAEVAVAVLLSTLVLLSVLGSASSDNANVKLVDGVYQNLLLGVKPGTDEPVDAAQFVQKVKGFLEAGGASLHKATGGRAAFGGAVTLVLPRHWDHTKFDNVGAPDPLATAAAADFLLHDEADAVPDTLQEGQCGVPGRQIRLPTTFLALTAEDERIYGRTGDVGAHEWAHYRYGAQDEHGWAGDTRYGEVYGDDDEVTACSVGALTGKHRLSCPAGEKCRPGPGIYDCFFCLDADLDPALVRASLAYLPALSTGEFCTAETHNSASPSPQNLLCGRRSVTELINLHPDMTATGGGGGGRSGAVPPINVNLKQEPIGRVLLLLDTPQPGAESLDYRTLLNELQEPLEQFPALELSMVSYRVPEQGSIEFYNTRDYARITDYDELYSLLPKAQSSSTVPSLSEVLKKLLTTQSSYPPGTLLVIPVTNTLMEEAHLDQQLGNDLHALRMKPLLLYPEAVPNLAAAGAWLQRAGARFLYRNATTGPVDYASLLAKQEVSTFVENTFRNDHPILRIDEFTVTPGTTVERMLFYQRDVVHHKVAVITSSRPITELQVQYKRYGVFRPCPESVCVTTEDTIFYKQTDKSIPSPGEEWGLAVRNLDPKVPADVTITWSGVTFAKASQELDVEVWSSEGRGPIADIPENNKLILYVSVMDGELQVLGSRVRVYADIAVTSTTRDAITINKLELQDDGNGLDIRKDDSVFTASIDGVFEEGDILTVNAVYLESHSFSGNYFQLDNIHPDDIQLQELNHPEKATRGPQEGYKRATKENMRTRIQGSGLFTMDPSDSKCCGSFVQKPTTDLSQLANGYDLYLWNVYSTVITRYIGPKDSYSTTTTTTTKSTTIPTTTTTTTKTTTTTTAATTTTSIAAATTTTSIAAATTTTSIAAATTTIMSTTVDKSAAAMAPLPLLLVAATIAATLAAAAAAGSAC